MENNIFNVSPNKSPFPLIIIEETVEVVPRPPHIICYRPLSYIDPSLESEKPRNTNMWLLD